MLAYFSKWFKNSPTGMNTDRQTTWKTNSITFAVLEGFDKWKNRSLGDVCYLPEVTQSEAAKTNQLLNKNQSRRLLFLGGAVLILILGGNMTLNNLFWPEEIRIPRSNRKRWRAGLKKKKFEHQVIATWLQEIHWKR